MRQLAVVAVISWACLGAPVNAGQDPGTPRPEQPRTEAGAQEGPSLQDSMDFILAHLTDLHAEYVTEGLQQTAFKRAITHTSSSERCELQVKQQLRSDTEHGRATQELVIDDKFPLAQMAGAEVRIGQPTPAGFAQSATPARINVLILTSVTPAIEEVRGSNRIGDPDPDRNGVTEVTLVQRQVTYYASDEMILPRLAAALNRAIRLCGGKPGGQ